MPRLEDLQPNTGVLGILPGTAVQVVAVQRFSEALERTYTDPADKVANQLVSDTTSRACQSCIVWR